MFRPACFMSGFVSRLRLKYRRQDSSGSSSIVYLLTRLNLQPIVCVLWGHSVFRSESHFSNSSS